MKCPQCNSTMSVKTYVCDTCHSELTGHFTTDQFDKLDNNEKEFIKVFFKYRGNIKKVGDEIGKSSPTVSKMVDDLYEKIK